MPAMIRELIDVMGQHVTSSDILAGSAEGLPMLIVGPDADFTLNVADPNRVLTLPLPLPAVPGLTAYLVTCTIVYTAATAETLTVTVNFGAGAASFSQNLLVNIAGVASCSFTVLANTALFAPTFEFSSATLAGAETITVLGAASGTNIACVPISNLVLVALPPT